MKISLLIAMAALFGLTACDGGRPSYKYRYRLTLSVRDYGKTSVASNVVEVTERPPWKGALGITWLAHTEVCGEATVLPLRNQKFLIALLSGGSYPEPGHPGWRTSPTSMLLHHLGLEENWWADPSGIKALASKSKVITLTKHEDMPRFVVVRDRDDPLSFRASSWPTQDPEWLGNDVIFQSIKIQTTTDRITRGRVAITFPWLGRYESWHTFLNGKPHMGFEPKEFERCD